MFFNIFCNVIFHKKGGKSKKTRASRGSQVAWGAYAKVNFNFPCPYFDYNPMQQLHPLATITMSCDSVHLWKISTGLWHFANEPQNLRFEIKEVLLPAKVIIIISNFLESTHTKWAWISLGRPELWLSLAFDFLSKPFHRAILLDKTHSSKRHKDGTRYRSAE